MASRRGMANSERLALNLANVTATGAVVAAPCYVYTLDASLSDTNATGVLSVGDSSAAGDLVKESTRLDFRLGNGGASAAGGILVRNFIPPLYIATQLFFANSTGVNKVSVSYLAAS